MSITTYTDIARTSVANTFTANQTFSARMMIDRGADVASANDITLGADGQTFTITGTTNVQRIATASWNDGAIIALRFSSALCQISHNTAAGGGFASILLGGASAYMTAANDVLFFQYDSTTVAFRQIVPSSFKASEVVMLGRLQKVQGVDLASATNLSLGFDGNVFELTGTTAVTLISNIGWQEGSEVTLIANESVVMTHGTATSTTNITILLAGAANYSMTAGDTLKLCLCSTTAGGQAWREISRTVI